MQKWRMLVWQYGQARISLQQTVTRHFTERGLVPGNGSFVTLMESASGVLPLFVGKPESHMLEFIMAENGYRKEEMIMIGDNYDTDIQAGIRFGIDTIHVAGGVTSLEEVLLKSQRPTYSYQTLLDWLI